VVGLDLRGRRPISTRGSFVISWTTLCRRPPVAIEIRVALTELDGQPAFRIAVATTAGIAGAALRSSTRSTTKAKGTGLGMAIASDRRSPQRPDPSRGDGPERSSYHSPRTSMTRLQDCRRRRRVRHARLLSADPPTLGKQVVAGQTAVSWSTCAHYPPDLVITDIRCPTWTGSTPQRSSTATGRSR
jgi:hypothetical protein